MQSKITETEWLKAENWQDVLDDPSTLPPNIRHHLEAENTLAEEWLGGPDARDWILQELKATIRDEDTSVPIEDGPYRYWQRFRAGAEHPDFLRQHQAHTDLEVLLSGDTRAHGHAFYDLGSADHSPDHRYFAVTEDVQGSERYTLTVFVAGTDRPFETPLTDCRGDFEWSSDSKKLLYTRLDKHQRPSSVWCHTLGTSQTDDVLVFENPNPGRFIGLGKTSTETLITIDCHDHQTNQTFLLSSTLEDLNPIAMTDWIPELEYELEQVGNHLLLRTNHHHPDFALYVAPMPTGAAPSSPDQWRLLWAPPEGHLLSDYEVLEKHWVIETTHEGSGRYFVIEPNLEHFIERTELALESQIHDAHLDPLPGNHRDHIRLRISTPATAPQTVEVDLNTGALTVLKTSEPPNGHTPEHYVVKRHYGVSGDGQKIPLTLVHHQDLIPGPDTPVLLTGYGAYGMSLTPGFSATRRTLLTRGVLHVTAHVRGGMENGHAWYKDGRMAAKDNSFNDLIGAAETLIRDGLTSAGQIVLHGGSAGGLLVGTAVMRRPELFRGVIADVPFVDVLDTMLDDSLPLTPPEWPEWGNPSESKDAFRRLAHYTPTLMAEARHYPCILATAGLTDPRVTYWEPARWIQTLKNTGLGGPFLLYTELQAGHGGPSGRYAGLDDVARIYQAVIRLFDLPKEAPYAL